MTQQQECGYVHFCDFYVCMHGKILCILDPWFHNTEYDLVFPIYVQWFVQSTYFHYASYFVENKGAR